MKPSRATRQRKLSLNNRACWFRDLRAKAADDKVDLMGEAEAQKLLGHTDGRMTARHYLRRGKLVTPTR